MFGIGDPSLQDEMMPDPVFIKQTLEGLKNLQEGRGIPLEEARRKYKSNVCTK